MRDGCRQSCWAPAAKGSLSPPGRPQGTIAIQWLWPRGDTFQWAASSGALEGGFQASPQGFPASSLGKAPQDFPASGMPSPARSRSQPRWVCPECVSMSGARAAPSAAALAFSLLPWMPRKSASGISPSLGSRPHRQGSDISRSHPGTWKSCLWDRRVNPEPRGGQLVPGTCPDSSPPALGPSGRRCTGHLAGFVLIKVRWRMWNVS